MEQKPQEELTDSYGDPTFDPKGVVLGIFMYGIPEERSPSTDGEGVDVEEASDADSPTDGR
jgi:hypothetical protein